MRPFFAYIIIGKKVSSYRGEYGVSLHNLSVCVCVIFVVFTDCERGTKPISTNLGSTEAGQHGQMRGARFVAVRLEVVAVAGLMWVSWFVLGAAEFLGYFFLTIFVMDYLW